MHDVGIALEQEPHDTSILLTQEFDIVFGINADYKQESNACLNKVQESKDILCANPGFALGGRVGAASRDEGTASGVSDSWAGTRKKGMGNEIYWNKNRKVGICSYR